ncbi:pseudaminic acid synthase [Variovorax sp.]|jgi:pseudaminic acid synthase|uniref:pseudaminic acid synthase n=1 Tax=Variovorax sp. TaxID=1871043 RepID=UPI0037DA3964
MSSSIAIAGRKIGSSHPPYIICELSGNHNGSLDRALALVDAAADTGCDAIKLQTYTPDSLTIDCDSADFKIQGGLWDGRTLYDLYREAHTPYEWHEALFARARNRGVTIFSTPFDESAADFLDDLGAPAFKIASFEAVDLALIAHVARKKKPMIISTGLSNLGDIELAVNTARENGCEELVLLHCISSYPAPHDQSNLRTIPHLGAAFSTPVGLSDHTHGTAVSVAAIALGASVIEKHFTIARADGGADSAFSLEPEEFRRLCEDCAVAWKALGRIGYDLKNAEKGNLVFRRSLYAIADIAEGEVLSSKNVRSIRPGFGLPPRHLTQILGQRARSQISRGTPLSWEMIG